MTNCCKQQEVCVLPNQAVEFQAYITGWADTPIVQADIASISYSAWLYQPALKEEVEIENHQDVAVVVADAVLDTLEPWDVDSTGFNFKHTPELDNPLFDQRGQTYILRYTLVPANAAEENLVAEFLVKTKG